MRLWYVLFGIQMHWWCMHLPSSNCANICFNVERSFSVECKRMQRYQVSTVYLGKLRLKSQKGNEIKKGIQVSREETHLQLNLEGQRLTHPYWWVLNNVKQRNMNFEKKKNHRKIYKWISLFFGWNFIWKKTSKRNFHNSNFQLQNLIM